MRFVTNIAIGCIAVAAGLTACKSSQKTHAVANGTWQDQPIVVDGANNDWPSPYPFYDEKAKIGYVVTNDKDNLYVTMQTGDRMTIMKILRNGMTLWIDTSGKKAQNISVNYPMENADAPTHVQKDQTQPMDKMDADQMHKRMLESARDLYLTGFKGCNGSFLIKQNNGCGVNVRMGFDEYNTLIWEAVIPFKSFYKDALAATDAHKPIGICFSIKGLQRPKTDGGSGGSMSNGSVAGRQNMGNMGGGGGGMHGGGGGMHGGGMHGGGGVGGDREALFESSKTWYETGMAVK
ncbi:hypothetical protein [Taibaiella soli]|uniref:Uncharacterized protein n=1 Tax=Taibaiella soli TaxID=1649169 RepID=A0A2W2AVJ0_9BACT|nr:hypothetical protein [Taibaiella soli]PZF71974.1 hypothetical protein DN068_15165 [Taibaiella soli]